eukprot:676186-Pelagomonas_calceolata.AAC.2
MNPHPQRNQCHTHYEPMTIEKGALPFFKRAGFQLASTCTDARTDIACACCQICNYPQLPRRPGAYKLGTPLP